MTRDELTRKILAAKRAKSLTWKAVVGEIGGGSAVCLTAALVGQMKLRPEQAERAAKLFDLGEDEKLTYVSPSVEQLRGPATSRDVEQTGGGGVGELGAQLSREPLARGDPVAGFRQVERHGHRRPHRLSRNHAG